MIRKIIRNQMRVMKKIIECCQENHRWQKNVSHEKANFEDGVVGEPPVGVDEGDGEDEGREVLEEVDVDPAGEGAEGT